MSKPIRTRFAPAPTGFLHVGSARTALFNWLFARSCGGEMWLRIEDTDASLKTQAYVDAIISTLGWLDIDWDSGPHFQSDRKRQHEKAIEQLLSSGNAYHCDLTPEEVVQKTAAAGLPPGYHGWSRNRNVSDGPGVVIRFRSPDSGVTVVNDVIRGRVSFDNDQLEDFVIRRGDGSPTFLLANAVDDHCMGISHVIRGEDLLNTTPRVLLLWKALNYGEPATYAHLPLLVNSKRQKLSKRRDDVALDDYRQHGYLPEALVNYLALLGWGPSDGVEIRPLMEIVKMFKLDAVKPRPAFFDTTKLKHINASYIRSLGHRELAERAKPFMPQTVSTAGMEKDDTDIASYSEMIRMLASDITQRITTLSEISDWVAWIMQDTITCNEKAWRKVIIKGRSTPEVLAAVIAKLTEDDFTSAERLESIVMGVGDELSKRLGVRVLSQAPVRVAVTGTNVGLPLWKPLTILGKEKTLKRLEMVLEHLRAHSHGSG